jgi:hypothetical protein
MRRRSSQTLLKKTAGRASAYLSLEFAVSEKTAVLLRTV